MSFHYSAEDIRIEDGHILKARLQRADGEWNDSEIDLNNHIGNDNGESQWPLNPQLILTRAKATSTGTA